MFNFVAYNNSMSRRGPVPPGHSGHNGHMVLGPEHDMVGVNTRLGLPLCDNINVNRTSLRTPLLEDDRESCV